MSGVTGNSRAGRGNYQADRQAALAAAAQRAAEAAQRAQEAVAAQQARTNAQNRPNQATVDRIAVDPATVTHINEDVFIQETSSLVGLSQSELSAHFAEASADGEFSVNDFTEGVEAASSTLIHYGAEADPQAVESIQNTLVDAGALEAGTFEPGVFDESTEAAVVVFQEQNGLLVDGIVGPQTRDQLQVFADEVAPINAAYETVESTAAAIGAGEGPFTQENLDQVIAAQVTLEAAGDVEGAALAADVATSLITVSPNLQEAAEGGAGESVNTLLDQAEQAIAGPRHTEAMYAGAPQAQRESEQALLADAEAAVEALPEGGQRAAAEERLEGLRQGFVDKHGLEALGGAAVTIPETPTPGAFLNAETGEIDLQAHNAINAQLSELGAQVEALPPGVERDAAQAAYETFSEGVQASLATAQELTETVQAFNENLRSAGELADSADAILTIGQDTLPEHMNRMSTLLAEVQSADPALAAQLGARFSQAIEDTAFLGDGDIGRVDRRFAEAFMHSDLAGQLDLLTPEARVNLLKAVITRDADGDHPRDQWAGALSDSLVASGPEGVQALGDFVSSIEAGDEAYIGNDSQDFINRFNDWASPATREALETRPAPVFLGTGSAPVGDAPAAVPPYLPGAQPAAAPPPPFAQPAFLNTGVPPLGAEAPPESVVFADQTP